MPKLIILRGNSGSGKTTVAKELQKRFGRNTMLISQDAVRRDMLNVKDGEKTETMRRHQTKPNCGEFGEEAMRRWWREKDFSPVLKEKSITSEKELQDIVGEICGEVLPG